MQINGAGHLSSKSKKGQKKGLPNSNYIQAVWQTPSELFEAGT
jgi:hypothetical protein